MSGRYEQDLAGDWWYIERNSSKPSGFHRRRAQWYSCVGCGKPYLNYPKEVRRQSGYCSVQCGAGCNGSPLGSTREDRGGYVEVKTPDGWRKQHRVVMEDALGRRLTTNETVHHINGNRADNRLENLQLRQGHHGSGQVRVCLDCGSQHIGHVGLADQQSAVLV